MKRAAYPRYKPSGVGYLGDVPAHWEVARLKNLCTKSALYGANVATDHYADAGVRYIRTTDITDDGTLKKDGVFLPEELAHDYLLKDGDILLSRSGTVGRSFLYNSKLHGLCAYAGYLVRFIPSSQALPQYLFQFTKTQSFLVFLRAMAISSTIDNVNAEKYANVFLPIPPLSEQTAITDFLNRETGKTDALVAKKLALIERLKEKRGALITRAVTRGLNPDAPMKDSGVEYLGEVPAHWGTAAIKRNYSIQLGKMLQARANQATDIEVPYLKARHVQWFSVRAEDAPKMWASLDEIEQFGVREGDLIVCEGGEGGRCGMIGKIPSGYIIQNALHRVRSSNNCRNDYLQYVMGSVVVSGWLDAINNKATIAHFTGEKFGSLCMPIPPLPEQTAITDFLNRETGKIDALIAKVEETIERLKEHRSALITAAVTGRIDVRAAK